MNEMDKKSIRDKVEDSINLQRRLLITFPNKVYSRFTDYCKYNTADCYWLGIEDLLNYKESEIKNNKFIQSILESNKLSLNMVNEKLHDISNRVEELEKKSLEKKGEEPKKIKTFGRKENDE